MNEAQATGILILMFALRCVLPLVLVLLLGFFANRLVDRWEAEATAVPGKTPAVRSAPPAPAPTRALPCWLVRQCDPARQANCAAAYNTSAPCWVARTTQEGHLPANCDGCPVYNRQPLIA